MTTKLNKFLNIDQQQTHKKEPIKRYTNPIRSDSFEKVRDVRLTKQNKNYQEKKHFKKTPMKEIKNKQHYYILQK